MELGVIVCAEYSCDRIRPARRLAVELEELGRSRSGHDERLHGVKGLVGESAAQALGLIVRHVEMLLVEELLELVVIGLDLSLGDSTEEAVALGELQRVEQHLQRDRME